MDVVRAVKVITLRTGNARKRFEREARALAKLNHPGVVRIHQFGVEDGVVYLVQDFVEGTDEHRGKGWLTSLRAQWNAKE